MESYNITTVLCCSNPPNMYKANNSCKYFPDIFSFFEAKMSFIHQNRILD